MADTSVHAGHEPEVNAEAGAAFLAGFRAWLQEELGKDGSRQPGATDDDGSDEEVA